MTTARAVPLYVSEEVSFIVRLSPLFTVPDELVKLPLFTEYVPPVILIGAKVFIHVIVTIFEVTSADFSTPLIAVNWNVSGIISAGITCTVLVIGVAWFPAVSDTV